MVVVPSPAIVPPLGDSRSLLEDARRQVRLDLEVWAVTSNCTERVVLNAIGHDWLTATRVSSRHSPSVSAVGWLTVTVQLPAEVAGVLHVTVPGDGLGLGDGEGLGEGVGLGDGDGLGEGDGSGVGEGDGLGDGLGSGRWLPWTTTSTVAVAVEVPPFADSVKVVVQLNWTSFDPLAVTAPTPLSIWTVSAPSTSQLSVVEVPGVI
jgi:hypothetical protein